MAIFTFITVHPWLQLPIDNNAPQISCTIRIVGQDCPVAYFNIGLAQGHTDWYAPFNLSPFLGQNLVIETNADVSFDGLKFTECHWLNDCQDASARPLYHFAPTRGWNNDPNGLIYFNGEYHLFYQHNPYGIMWGNMHWGHAVSRDLIQWQDLDDVLQPDALGTIYSGSAVVDPTNATGLGETSNKATLILIYTASGEHAIKPVPYTQCIAVSQDGITFKKYPGNPVVPEYSTYNRDPKVYWDECKRRYVMAYYVSTNDNYHAVRFMSSSDMRSWSELSILKGSPILADNQHSDNFLYECPDFFKLNCNGNEYWTIFGANGIYALGDFDGTTFKFAKHADNGEALSHLPGIRGNAYAAQTFNGLPNGRRILMAWLLSPIDPSHSFSQCMSLPIELSLRPQQNGEPRLAYSPVPELASIFDAPIVISSQKLDDRRTCNLGKIPTACRLNLNFEISSNCILNMSLAGIAISYDAPRKDLIINSNHFEWPCNDGKLQLIVFIDRGSIEIFSADGFQYAAVALFPVEADGTIIASYDNAATLSAEIFIPQINFLS